MNKLANMLLYQATWLAAVSGAGNGLWWPGVAVFAVFAAWQLSVTPWRTADACLVVGAGALGFAIDSIYVQCGLMDFSTPVPWPGLAPVWMTMLWTSFALSLNHSLELLQDRPLVAALLGATGAPAAYWVAGSAWHALTFGAHPALTVAVTAALWAVLMPALARVARRLRTLDVPAATLAGARP